eukprot:970321-Prymnesium_polylepis.1
MSRDPSPMLPCIRDPTRCLRARARAQLAAAGRAGECRQEGCRQQDADMEGVSIPWYYNSVCNVRTLRTIRKEVLPHKS